MAGTFYCYVYAISPLASASLLANVQQALNDNAAYPATGTALNPDLVGISLETTIELKSGATTTDQQTAIAAATTAVQNYINNLGIAGQPNQPLNAIYIWRSRSDGTRYSWSLIADYTPATGERMVVEDTANADEFALILRQLLRTRLNSL